MRGLAWVISGSQCSEMDVQGLFMRMSSQDQYKQGSGEAQDSRREEVWADPVTRASANCKVGGRGIWNSDGPSE